VEVGEHRFELGQWQTAQRSADSAFVPIPRLLRELITRPTGAGAARPDRGPLLNFGAPHRRLDAVGSGEWASRDGVWVVGLHDRH
jgi:hypothetical protein